jgi:ribosomal protein S19
MFMDLLKDNLENNIEKKFVIFNKDIIINIYFLNRKILLYNGKSFINLIITENMIGLKFKDFLISKKMGPNIHNINLKQKIKKSKK